ncbi:bis(5'-nucleosyl)-tetraphosphatase (symmetrical) YqeK [Gloeobacter kilaueensis]|uniref:bis(5'-nucleosyl)-tetraphosphatase (symmetrical) n=1 Tax=Gloeobacter kilaueensis (strain ATCC BAA-2537 / CCAP 1431/1 / ULC 316 / JS1) TaxID=1183438 RepID=U5QDH4_GLOK1|nr:bis(5'-nucleosyl)-tetraphosphatase (symmetrical) YqeK [Gloeobacter kilaueensis]AGY56982.1 metal dependent phosphohydrolase [Gloeobacter kilaueensis JS1]
MPGPALKTTWRTPVLAWLEQHVPARRLTHILGVEATAIELAQRWGADLDRAGRAGLLHDLAKYFGPEQLLSEAERLGIPIDAIQRSTPHLLHADVSAGLARELFGETDPSVLAAIANHTLGNSDLDILSQILYVADWIEPTRRGEDVEIVRKAAMGSLRSAVLSGAEQTILELIHNRRLIHPRTLLTRNWALCSLQEPSQRC